MEPVLPFDLQLELGRHGTLVQSLHHQLRDAILDGRLVAGSELPSTRQLAGAQGVARNTAMAAYDLLVAEGYLRPRSNARPVVADVATRRQAMRARTAAPADACINPVWRRPELAREPSRMLPPRSFRLGMPEHRDFPHAVWRRLTAKVQRDFARAAFAYPPDAGIDALREAIASHVAFARAVACRADDVVVTSGAQQACDLLARLLVVPGRTRVAVEDPGYPSTRAPFVAAGAELVPVAVDDEGLCVAQLPADVRIVSVTPSHQSPTGVAMSLRRRRELLEFAQRTGAVVIEDDYDGEFRYGGRPLDALQTLDRHARVFYVGTFSKSLFPALRKGFVVAPAWAREPLLAVKHIGDAHADAIAQGVLAAFIRDGHMARHVRRMRGVYAARRVALLEGLARMDAWFEPYPGEAGLHLAARIRDEADAPRIIRLTQLHAPGVVDVAGLSMQPRAPALAFGYGVIDVESIGPSLRALHDALRNDRPTPDAKGRRLARR